MTWSPERAALNGDDVRPPLAPTSVITPSGVVTSLGSNDVIRLRDKGLRTGFGIKSNTNRHQEKDWDQNQESHELAFGAGQGLESKVTRIDIGCRTRIKIESNTIWHREQDWDQNRESHELSDRRVSPVWTERRPTTSSSLPERSVMVEEDVGVSTDNSSASSAESENFKIWTPRNGAITAGPSDRISDEKTPGHEATITPPSRTSGQKLKVAEDPRTNGRFDLIGLNSARLIGCSLKDESGNCKK
ncbi:hypothetical protein EVAR_99648_1 [Eumeta japonica]|uniref:Uncharacterized protein n=1 Tax=Eumeta variegata TaxID=151549 RepID=A0A4C1ZK92_EUMVA|nr:hypothetical protein EVAR_99648_1 [Eumeta japonica]